MQEREPQVEVASERVRRWTQKLNNLAEDIKKQSDENAGSFFSSLFK